MARTVSRRGIAKSSPGGPHPAAHLSTRHPGGSNVAISLPCYTPSIYVSTTPGRYLQPANKLIHYSTEQSSSLLCLGSFTSLLGSCAVLPPRAPFSSGLFREFCQRFGKAPFTPCCGDDDTSRFTWLAGSVISEVRLRQRESI